MSSSQSRDPPKWALWTAAAIVLGLNAMSAAVLFSTHPLLSIGLCVQAVVFGVAFSGRWWSR